MALVVGVIFGLTLVLGVVQISVGTIVGLDQANAGGNIPALAQMLFSRYVYAFEATSALLITAALGAMVLAHRERLTPKVTQGDMAAQRMRDYAEHGKHVGPLPAPGVYARHNAVDTPALLPDGTASESSVSRVLVARGTIRSAPAFADDIAVVSGQLQDDGSSNIPGEPDATPKGPLEGDPSETEDANRHHEGSDQ
jgi:NADH-quinone oxidoreductase subunit J